jgi:16S rRNA A1518/A1519 N6-dimethyltransferase RsmA/KsgA/DIM1 with predicted DNA glycosylase/AP lyase activity
MRARLGPIIRFHEFRARRSERAVANLLGIEPERESMTDLISALQKHGTQHLVFEPASFRDIREIVTALGLDRGDVVYDLGAGYGHFVCYGACVTSARFEAIEIVARRCVAIERAAARLGLTSLRVRQADAETVPLSRASVLFLNSPFFAEKAERFLARLAAQRPWRPLRIVAMNNIVRQLRASPRFSEIQTTARIASYRFGVFRPKPPR